MGVLQHESSRLHWWSYRDCDDLRSPAHPPRSIYDHRVIVESCAGLYCGGDPMKHPPTECDRALKTKVITDGDIAKSVSWYEQNWNRISVALPITIGGTTYTAKWQKVFDYQTLPQWRAGKASKRSHGLRVAYIYLTLTRLFKGLQEAGYETR